MYVTYDGLTDALGQSQILSYLSKLGNTNEFYVLSFEKKKNYQKNITTVSRIVKDKNIHWIKNWYTKKPPIASTLYDIYTAIKEAKKLHKIHCFDIVHCRGYVPAMIGLQLKKKFGIKFIFDMRGWWPDEKIESGSWSKPIFQPVYKYFKQKEKEFFKCADFNISLTEAGKKEMIERFKLSNDKIGVIPTCVNFEVFKENSKSKRETIRKRIGIENSARVLVYSGALGGNYDLCILKSVFIGFNSAFPDPYILILSNDSLSESFEQELRQEKILNYTVCNVSYNEVSDYLCAADVGMIFYKPAFSNIGRSPTKLGEYWASGLPVIATEGIGDLQLLQEKYPNGIVLINNTVNDMGTKLRALIFSNHSLLRSYAKDYCSLEKGVAFYDSVYQKMIN